MILNAGSADSLVAAAALEQLCRRYGYPLYACVRRSGYSHDDAADLTQSFVARVVEKKTFTGLEPGVARFRCVLNGAPFAHSSFRIDRNLRTAPITHSHRWHTLGTHRNC